MLVDHASRGTDLLLLQCGFFLFPFFIFRLFISPFSCMAMADCLGGRAGYGMAWHLDVGEREGWVWPLGWFDVVIMSHRVSDGVCVRAENRRWPSCQQRETGDEVARATRKDARPAGASQTCTKKSRFSCGAPGTRKTLHEQIQLCRLKCYSSQLVCFKTFFVSSGF